MSNNEKNESTNEKFSENIENIRQTGAVRTENRHSRIHTLIIAGQVEGHYELPSGSKSTKYEHVIPQLVEVEENEIWRECAGARRGRIHTRCRVRRSRAVDGARGQ